MVKEGKKGFLLGSSYLTVVSNVPPKTVDRTNRAIASTEQQRLFRKDDEQAKDNRMMSLGKIGSLSTGDSVCSESEALSRETGRHVVSVSWRGSVRRSFRHSAPANRKPPCSWQVFTQ